MRGPESRQPRTSIFSQEYQNREGLCLIKSKVQWVVRSTLISQVKMWTICLLESKKCYRNKKVNTTKVETGGSNIVNESYRESSGQHGGIGRNALLPCTTKRRVTTNLKTINNQKCQKIKLHGTPTTKELKKHSSRPAGGCRGPVARQ